MPGGSRSGANDDDGDLREPLVAPHRGLSGGAGADGKTSTANFLSGLMKSVPPLEEVFALSGLALPEYLGKKKEASPSPEAASPEVEALDAEIVE